MNIRVFVYFVQNGQVFYPSQTLKYLQAKDRLDLLPMVQHFCPITPKIKDLLCELYPQDKYFHKHQNTLINNL
jgi:hypothetical protein